MKTTKPIVLIVLLLSVVLTACSTQTQTNSMPEMSTMPPVQTESAAVTPPVAVSRAEVTIANFAYSPQSISVKVGTTVTWTNQDSIRHSVTSDTGVFDSGLIGKDATFSYTFNEVGVFPYHCTPHPYMVAIVTVVE